MKQKHCGGQMKLSRSTDIINAVRDIFETDGKDLRTMLYKDLILNSVKCKRDELDVLDLKVLDRAMAEFRHAACVFKEYRSVPKVSIFGSARVNRSNPYYQMATRLGRLLSEEGFMVITGAASGVMRAGIEGAGLEKSFGANILLPAERGLARVIRDDPKTISFKYFFTRKIFFVMEARAVALLPGGFGTHDELFEVLTLLQTGKARPMPVVLLEYPHDDYWETWERLLRHQMLPRRLIFRQDLSFYRIVRSPEEGLDWIKSYYSVYNSMRQVCKTLVIRLEKELPESAVEKLNESFGDLIASGKVFKTRALPEEDDEPGLKDKPRIAFNYNKVNAGRLNEMILMINSLGRMVS